MRALLSLLSSLSAALLFVFCGVQVASAIIESPQKAPVFLDMDAGSVWTSTPERIDRSAQTFERLPTPPDPFPLKFRVGPRLKVFDSASFALDGNTYRLSGVDRIERNKVCVGADGRKTACGFAAFKRLDNALRGQFLQCRLEGRQGDTQLVRCQVSDRDLAVTLQDQSDKLIAGL